MKKTFKNAIAILLCLILIISTASVSFAASVGKVKTLKVSSTTQTAVKLKWSAVSKATGYRVYSYDAEAKEWVTEKYTASTSFTDKELQPGTKYIYKVRAYVTKNGKKTYGSASSKVIALTKPNKVDGVVASKVTGSSVKLKWEEADGAKGYIVYQRDAKTGEYKKIGTTTKLTYTVKFDSAPGTVYFKVKSYAKSSGLTQYSGFSSYVKAVVKTGSISALTASDQKEASVTLVWNKCDGAAGYILYKMDISNGNFEEFDRTANENYKVVYPSSPGRCFFKVRPYSEVNGEIILGTLSPYVVVDMFPTKLKTVKVTEEAMNSVTLSWQPAEGAAYYEIYRLMANKKYELIDSIEKTTYTVSGLDFSSSYSFKIRTVSDYAGRILNAPFSDVITARTKFGEITGVKFTVDTDNKAYLMWDETNDADGYIVEKKVGNEWQTISDSLSTLCIVSDFEKTEKLQPGNSYVYRIKAYMKTSGENEYSKYTDEIQIKAVPNAPGEIKTATGSEHSIVLQWKKVEGADGYDIFYYDSDNGVWREYQETEGVQYNSIAGTELVYFVDKGLEESGIYQYKIRAFVKNGDIKSVGAFSDVVTHEYTYSADRDQLFEGGLNSAGAIGYLYDEKYDCFYTAGDPWQRNFGFNEIYDITAQWVLLQYDTVRFKFKYQGQDWMIQPWKGQYGWILYGGEIGVYVKYTDRGIEHYDCAKDGDLLMMSMDLYRYWEDSGKWELAFKRPYSSYWWCTGFKPGFIKFGIPGTTSYKNELRLDLRVTMKDFEMLEAFTNSLETLNDSKYAPYKNVTGTNKSLTDGKSYRVDGLDVYFSFK